MLRRALNILCCASVIAALAPQSHDALAETKEERFAALMKLRHERMKNELGGSMNLIDEEIHGASPDKAKIAKAARTILASSKDIPGWFPKGTGPETGWGLAKDEIWQKPEEFKAATTRMIAEAEKLVGVSAGQAPAVAAQLRAAAAACNDCHKAFRIPPP